uniref:YaaA family protein n=1 Tax=uncultured Sphingomonas sp. TaxID=158754 RepID=UPI0025D658B5|nr:YaaA family protein [uncultured Sphingomonas sp.]
MIILLSPAKTLDLTSPYAERPTEARFAAEANRIARAAAKLGPGRLAELMHLSPKLAALNAARFKTFARAEERPAIRAFAGDVYRGFDAASADEDTIAFAQEHLRILSGLYGVLRPLDAIRPYRLEMGTRWAPTRDKLTDHWGSKVARAVLSDLKADGSGTILNLASNEYYAAVGPHLPKRGVRVIAPDFRVRTAEGLQFHSFTAKVARGTMARWVCDERVADLAALPSFERDGWRYDAEGSTPDKPLYVRG